MSAQGSVVQQRRRDARGEVCIGVYVLWGSTFLVVDLHNNTSENNQASFKYIIVIILDR